MKPNQKIVLILVVIGIISLSALYAYNESSKAPAIPKQTPIPTKAQTTKSSTPKTTPKENKFSIEIIDVKEKGALSRVVTAKLVNNDGYVKNVKVTLELFVDNDRVKVNGKDALITVVGDMDAKSSVEKEVEISVGFFDGLKIKSKGYVDAKLTISWDKGREVFKKRIGV